MLSDEQRYFIVFIIFSLCCCMDIPQQETEMDINLLYLSQDNNGNYLFYYLRSGVVHSNQKQSVRLREAHWFPQSPTIIRITEATTASGPRIVLA